MPQGSVLGPSLLLTVYNLSEIYHWVSWFPLPLAMYFGSSVWTKVWHLQLYLLFILGKTINYPTLVLTESGRTLWDVVIEGHLTHDGTLCPTLGLASSPSHGWITAMLYWLGCLYVVLKLHRIQNVAVHLVCNQPNQLVHTDCVESWHILLFTQPSTGLYCTVFYLAQVYCMHFGCVLVGLQTQCNPSATQGRKPYVVLHWKLTSSERLWTTQPVCMRCTHMSHNSTLCQWHPVSSDTPR